MQDDSSAKPPDGAETKPRPNAVRYFAVLAFLGTALGGVVWYAARQNSPDDVRGGSGSSGGDNAESQAKLAVPDVAPSRFRNTAKSVAYVGNDACVACHADEHKSYLETTHSRALATIDVAREPPDAEFHHKISGRHYRVYRDGKDLRHREYILDADDKEVVLADHAMKYAMGSGNFSRSYLLEIDGYMFQSPMTWYTAAKKWKMSPGYENNRLQPGFSRPIDSGCMTCHSGRLETVGKSYHRVHVSEMSISCERCHGPGGLHVKEREAGLPIKGGFDDTIVNLKHLSRERQEDVCSQCHLPSSSKADVRGRTVDEFRPGLRMADFSVGYRIDKPESEMTVVGHVEQMKLSRCYTASKSMTCTTCHDPHSLPPEEEKVTYYRAKCVACHEEQPCKLPVKTRLEKQPADSCIACHMPTGDTEIPHFAFTHHRVGIHPDQPAKAKRERHSPTDRLIPIDDISHFPPIEQTRLLGLVMEKHSGALMGIGGDPQLGVLFRERSRRNLEEFTSKGLRDPEVETELSLMYWRRDPERCVMYAKRALESDAILPKSRRYALFPLASTHFDAGDGERASPVLKELLNVERSDISLMMMAVYQRRQGNFPEVVRLVKKAIEIVPYRANLHTYLAEVYAEMGNRELEQRHLKRAGLLRRVVPQSKADVIPVFGRRRE